MSAIIDIKETLRLCWTILRLSKFKRNFAYTSLWC